MVQKTLPNEGFENVETWALQHHKYTLYCIIDGTKIIGYACLEHLDTQQQQQQQRQQALIRAYGVDPAYW